MPWKVFHQDNGKYAIHKINEDGSRGEMVPPVYDTAAEAQAQIKKLFTTQHDFHTERVVDQFVSTHPGEPYRLLPFGPIKRARGGPAREITPESAAKFRLPHFKPPVKLGSHEDNTPAGGHIVGLEVRTDGLYAIPEWNDRGHQTVSDGSYRYHSPEIIWDEGAVENATTGEWINGPLIVGDALLHTPALGDATALYTSQISHGGNTMTDETISVPKTLMEQLAALFKPAVAKVDETVPVTVDEYSAIKSEAEKLRAELDQYHAQKAHETAVAKYSAYLQSDRFGQEFTGNASGNAAEMLASMSTEQADWILERLAAMAARIDYSKLSAIGTDSSHAAGDPRQAFAAAIDAKMTANKMSYQDAYTLVKNEAPDLFRAYHAYVPKTKGE